MMFLLKEALNSIRRNKSGAFFSFISIMLAILFTLAAAIIYDAGLFLEKKIQSSLTIQIYLKDNVSDKRAFELKRKLESSLNFENLRYINKAEAERFFLEKTGEDFRKFLEYNPLPSSYEGVLKLKTLSEKNLESIKNELKNYPEVDEIVIQEEFIETALSFLKKARNYVIISALILIFLSLFIVRSVFKIIIKSRALVFETMKLVGARIIFMRGVIIVSGIILGVVASLFFYGIFFGGLHILERKINFTLSILFFYNYYKFIILMTGPLLGFLGSFSSSKLLSLKLNRNEFSGL